MGNNPNKIYTETYNVPATSTTTYETRCSTYNVTVPGYWGTWERINGITLKLEAGKRYPIRIISEGFSSLTNVDFYLTGIENMIFTISNNLEINDIKPFNEYNFTIGNNNGLLSEVNPITLECPNNKSIVGFQFAESGNVYDSKIISNNISLLCSKTIDKGDTFTYTVSNYNCNNTNYGGGGGGGINTPGYNSNNSGGSGGEGILLYFGPDKTNYYGVGGGGAGYINGHNGNNSKLIQNTGSGDSGSLPFIKQKSNGMEGVIIIEVTTTSQISFDNLNISILKSIYDISIIDKNLYNFLNINTNDLIETYINDSFIEVIKDDNSLISFIFDKNQDKLFYLIKIFSNIYSKIFELLQKSVENNINFYNSISKITGINISNDVSNIDFKNSIINLNYNDIITKDILEIPFEKNGNLDINDTTVKAPFIFNKHDLIKQDLGPQVINNFLKSQKRFIINNFYNILNMTNVYILKQILYYKAIYNIILYNLKLVDCIYPLIQIDDINKLIKVISEDNNYFTSSSLKFKTLQQLQEKYLIDNQNIINYNEQIPKMHKEIESNKKKYDQNYEFTKTINKYFELFCNIIIFMVFSIILILSLPLNNIYKIYFIILLIIINIIFIIYIHKYYINLNEHFNSIAELNEDSINEQLGLTINTYFSEINLYLNNIILLLNTIDNTKYIQDIYKKPTEYANKLKNNSNNNNLENNTIKQSKNIIYYDYNYYYNLIIMCCLILLTLLISIVLLLIIPDKIKIIIILAIITIMNIIIYYSSKYKKHIKNNVNKNYTLPSGIDDLNI